MSFLAPLTLIGLALLALPVLIHLLVRRRAQRLDFPTLAFLRETPSFRLRPRRVRQPLLLALRLAALALLIAGLARPFLSFNASRARTRVILLDASLSMSTRGRASAAMEQARAIINRLGEGERASLVAFASGATVLAEATEDRKALLKALAGYEPVGGAADYSIALVAAGKMLQREPPGSAEIDLISDFQQSGLLARTSLSQAVAQAAAPINTFAVGAQIERNAFLTDETVERIASGIELSATEIVTGPEGQTGTRRTWTIDASNGDAGGARPDLEWHTQSNGQVTGVIRANAPDDLDADDQRFFAFTPPREARVLLVETEGDGPYLRAALEASGVERPSRLALERRKELPPSASDLAAYALVVLTLHGTPGPDTVRVLSDYAGAGGTVWLCLARDLDVEGWNALALREQGTEQGTAQRSAWPFVSLARMESAQPFGLGPIDGDAPALSSMGEGALSALRALRVREGYRVTPRESAATLARWSDGTPAFVSTEVGAGSLLLLATSTEREASELGLSPALPALAGSILSAASRAREPLSRATGEPVQLGLHPTTKVSVTDTAGHTTFVMARELARDSPSVFRAPGVYRIEFAGQQRFLAFNTPVTESSRALATPEEIKSHLGQTARGVATGPQSAWREAAERRGQLWRLFLCAAFILLLAELFVSMRAYGRVEI
jgi:Aerotolerance regulator N-terminal/von Willebrand factor type A domain